MHSLADSILGALSEGDIGTAFPEDDPKSKDLDSQEIIIFCLDLMKKRGYHLNNIDITVISEIPKIKPIRNKIINSLSEIPGYIGKLKISSESFTVFPSLDFLYFLNGGIV